MVAKHQLAREYDELTWADLINGEMVGQLPEYLRAIQVPSKEILFLIYAKNMPDLI